jgi:hypothetical protein
VSSDAGRVDPTSLPSLSDWERFPWCPTCGPVERLVSEWAVFDDPHRVLYCGVCHRALVAL